jgi:hypothetical protein
VLAFRRFARGVKEGDPPQVQAEVTDQKDVTALVPNNFDSTISQADAKTEKPQPQQRVEHKERQKIILESNESPLVHIADHTVSAKAGSPYRIEVLVRQGEELMSLNDGRLRMEEGGTGDHPEKYAFADLRLREEYVVKIYNDSDYDAGVELSIDGLNIFEFADPEYRHFKELGYVLIPAHGAGVIPGWFRSPDYADAFEIRFLPDSAAALLKRDAGRIGTISARFFAAWDPSGPPPPIEPLVESSKDFGTARGREVPGGYETVKRQFGRSVLASVNVFYRKPSQDLPPE